MKERPILFSGPMVRAILAGTKTQTRRLAVMQTCGGHRSPVGGTDATVDAAWIARVAPCHHGAPGDRLWVRETWTEGYPGTADPILYRATYEGGASHTWRPSIFMRRHACRIILEIASVRAERLQDITNDDIAAEGITPEIAAEMTGWTKGCNWPLREAWQRGWDAINGKRAAWASNPWVWRIEFRRLP